MKVKLYKAKSFKGKEVIGYIYQQPEYTRYGFDDFDDIPIETYIIVPSSGDWGLPYSMQPILVDPSTIEEYKDIEIGGVDKIS